MGDKAALAWLDGAVAQAEGEAAGQGQPEGGVDGCLSVFLDWT